MSAQVRMHRLRVTPGGKYVLWLDRRNRPAAIWAFEDVRIAFRGTAETGDGKRVDTANGVLSASGQEGYLLSGGTADERSRGSPQARPPCSAGKRDWRAKLC